MLATVQMSRHIKWCYHARNIRFDFAFSTFPTSVLDHNICWQKLWKCCNWALDVHLFQITTKKKGRKMNTAKLTRYDNQPSYYWLKFYLFVYAVPHENHLKIHIITCTTNSSNSSKRQTEYAFYRWAWPSRRPWLWVRAVFICMLPLHIEAEMACAGLDKILGLKMIHAFCGGAINGQNDVSNAHLGSGCLATVSELQWHTKGS